MLTNEQYINQSLELNLFFLRIIREHTYFTAASLPPRDSSISMQLMQTKRNIDRLLVRTINLSKGNISSEVMSSGELVTPFTLQAEKATQYLVGLPVDISVTEQELNLGFRQEGNMTPNIMGSVYNLNNEAINLTSMVINFKNNLQKNVLSCRAFSFLYPLNIDHVIREETHYLNMLRMLQNRQDEDTTARGLIEHEILWNDLMGEHAKFIRGYLDPSEVQLFEKANNFAAQYDQLETVTKALITRPENLNTVTKQSYSLTTELRNFKRQGTQGILACKIKSIIPPLLADHVTREANRYLRILRAASAQ